jgi:hypothetical protein
MQWRKLRRVKTTIRGSRKSKSQESRGERGECWGLWLNHDREKQMVTEELEGAEHKWSLWESLEVEKG